mgnify:CR=1 FL=1
MPLSLGLLIKCYRKRVVKPLVILMKTLFLLNKRYTVHLVGVPCHKGNTFESNKIGIHGIQGQQILSWKAAEWFSLLKIIWHLMQFIGL